MTSGQCTVCGASFEYDETKRGRRRKQCSKRCTNAVARAKVSASKQAARQATAAPCARCESPVDVPTRGPVPQWCSAACREFDMGRRKDPMEPRLCALPGCFAEFTPAHDSVRCCSERHGKALWNRESRADGRQANPAWSDARRENYQRRRALKKGADAERFSNAEIFERDAWVCGLCQEPVDRDLAWPDPRSPSLDHVLPLSKGGSHTKANVQLAHLGCNVEKGARVAA